MRVVVTGGSGFIGGEAVRLLCDMGHETISIGRTTAFDKRAHHHRCDLMDSVEVERAMQSIRPTHCLHLAWYAEPGLYWTSPQNLAWVAASLNLARNFAACGGKRLVVSGTCAEYEWSGGTLVEETTPLSPATLYGEAKASLGKILSAASQPLGFSLGWGRIFNPYGPKERPERLLGTIIQAARKGIIAEFSAGTQKRDFMHVEDVARALVTLLQSNLQRPVNIGTGHALSVREFAEVAAYHAGISDKLNFKDVVQGDSEPPLLIASVDRLTNELQFKPRFDAKTGIRHAISSALS